MAVKKYEECIESLDDFRSAKIGKDMYPYLKHYYNELMEDSLRPTKALLCRKLIYLFMEARDGQVPMLSELTVTLNTLIYGNNVYENSFNPLLQEYIRYIERIIPFTVQGASFFLEDDLIRNSEVEVCPQNRDLLPESLRAHLIVNLRFFVNRDNYLIEPMSFKEFSKRLLKEKDFRYLMKGFHYFPSFKTFTSFVDPDFDIDLIEDDDNCKEISFALKSNLDSNVSMIEYFLEQENEKTQENIAGLSEEAISQIEDRIAKRVISVLDSRFESIETRFESIENIIKELVLSVSELSLIIDKFNLSASHLIFDKSNYQISRAPDMLKRIRVE